MKNILAAAVVLSAVVFVSPSLTAQGRSTPRTQVMPAVHSDLNSALIDLDRISQATQSDISNMQVEKWKSGWKSGFLKGNSHTQQAQQAAGSLRRNLVNAMPGLIHDVQNSRGSISSTFKLYDDVSLVCEALDSLITASEAAGHKGEAAPLLDDFSALTRVRRSLSAYIQQASASWETRGKAPYAAFSAPVAQPAPRTNSSAPTVITDGGVKKIIIDDTVPEKKAAPPAKKKPVTLTNLQ